MRWQSERMRLACALFVAIPVFITGCPAAPDKSLPYDPTKISKVTQNSAWPLRVVAKKDLIGKKRRPKKVADTAIGLCASDTSSDPERACRKPGDDVVWIVVDSKSHNILQIPFELCFKKENPLVPASPQNPNCYTSSPGGVLEAMVRSDESLTLERDYEYKVTIDGRVHDPRIYVNNPKKNP